MWLSVKRNVVVEVFWYEILLASVPMHHTSSIESSSTQIECNTWKAFSSNCYKIFTDFEYFDTARTTCRFNDGDLATIDSETENTFLQQLIANETSHQEAWIGMRRKNFTFIWINGENVNYKNWMFGRPTGRGDCVEMIPGGTWANTLCNYRMQYVCKKGPTIIEDNSKLYLIMHITIPLSCALIMLLFVGFLCMKSLKELKEVKLLTKEASPFQLVQAAMVLPMSKAPNLLRASKGKNLWQGAIEKIKEEQLRNNPLNNPRTFLQRSNGTSATNDNCIANNNSMKSGSKFSSIVQALMRNRPESIILDGTLGTPDIPSITIENNYASSDSASKIEKVEKRMTDNMKPLEDTKSSSSNNSENSTPPKSAKMSSMDETYKSKIDIWLKQTEDAVARKESLSSLKQKAFMEDGKQPAIDIEDDEIDADEQACKTQSPFYSDKNKNNENDIDKTNLVKVTVHVNHHKRLPNQSISPYKRNIFNIYSADKTDAFISPPDFLKDSNVKPNAKKNQIPSETEKENYYSIQQPPFDYLLQRESLKKKEKCFPEVTSGKLDMEQTDGGRSPPVTKLKKVKDDFVKVTIC